MSSLSSKKASCWSITINNPTDDDHKQINDLPSKPWFKSWEGQMEEGEDGTPHIQGMLRTKSVIFGSVKKALSRAHIEVAKNVLALKQYVHKDETRTGELKSLKVFTNEDFYQHIKEFYDSYEEVAAAYQKYLDDREDAEVDKGVDNFPYKTLKQIASSLIVGGQSYVEILAVNPQMKSSFKEYFLPIMKRTFNNLRCLESQVSEAHTPRDESLLGENESVVSHEDSLQ
nr:MAG: replication associated protein [Cressdnaviricota sp.]